VAKEVAMSRGLAIADLHSDRRTVFHHLTWGPKRENGLCQGTLPVRADLTFSIDGGKSEVFSSYALISGDALRLPEDFATDRPDQCAEYAQGMF
jgi:hypothetical protein